MSKQKTVDLGKVVKYSKATVFQFDSSIKSVTLERELTIDGEKITEKVKVPVNDKGYLESAFINKTEDYFNFKASQGWMDADKAEGAKNKCLENGISSFFSIKVES